MAKYTFGELDNIKEGDIFRDREALMKAGIHSVRQAGINGNRNVGCCSIVLSDGYPDDIDLGNEIIYTGEGGNINKKQFEDQSWERNGNKALIVSELRGLPVRVTRGYKHKSKFSPKIGYQYAGLYLVTEHFEEIGKDGFKICRYKLEKLETEIIENPIEIKLSNGNKNTKRIEVTTQRIIRDTKLAKEVKALYNYECQICGMIIEVSGVRYAEAAHIKPLGKPHNGEDTPENIICLCPNHHVMFDKGVFYINQEYKIKGLSGYENLKLNNTHNIKTSNLEYHNKHIFIDKK
jgi:putative restriction endonuclease